MLKQMKYLILFVLVSFASLNAAPVNGVEFSFKQPDGSRVPVRVWGDEFYQDVESLDGYTLIRGSDGWIYYAKLSADGNEYVPTKVKYTGTNRAAGVRKGLRINKESVIEKQGRARAESGHDELIQSRQQLRSSRQSRKSILPQSNNLNRSNNLSRTSQAPEEVVGLVVLVDFPDQPATIARSAVEEAFNSVGGVSGNSLGSVYDYFYNASYGQMEYTSIVTGFITMDSAKAYYEDNTSLQHWMFVGDVIAKLNEIGFDPSGVTTYDGENGAKIIQSFSVIYAGDPDAGWNKGLWPSAYFNTASPREYISGLGVSGSQITNMGTGTSFPGGNISTIIHELGHLVMGWPDLYAYYNGSKDYVNSWCVMAYHNYQGPQRPNPYLRLLAGWIDTTHFTHASIGTVYSHTANSPLAYVYMRDTMDNPNTTDKEFYMLEARVNTGDNRYNWVPMDGLQVWHIHTGGKNTEVNRFPLVAHRGTFAANLSGREDFHKDRDTLPARYHKDTVVAYGDEAGVYTGVFSKINIAEISNVDEVMTFKVGGSLVDTLPSSGDTVTYEFSGFDAYVIDSIRVKPAGVTILIQNPNYTHGAMISVRNMGLNDSVAVEWFGGIDQNNPACIDESVNLFGNGAQINNFVSPKRGDGSVLVNIRSTTIDTVTVEIKIYNWANGQGCPVPLSKSKAAVQSAPVSAVNTWECGSPVLSTVTATLEDETLTISGSGDMRNFNINEAGVNANWGPLNYDKIIIGDNITYIGIGVFANLGVPLSSVSCLSNTPPTVGIEAFLGRAKESASLYVPQGSENTYRAAPVWKDFGYINPSTVKFDSQGGNPIDTQKISYGGKVTKPANPSKTGYTFGGWYKEAAYTNEWNFDTDTVTSEITLLAKWTSTTSILSDKNVVPPAKPSEEAVVFAPVNIAAGEFSAGPNPVSKSSGGIAFFWQGKRITGTLSVYDVAGNVVQKVKIQDNALNSQAKRKVGSWDLTDKKGRQVPEGTYLVKGKVATSSGKAEKVSVILSVR